MGWCTAQCKMLLFYANTILKESHNFELAVWRRRKKEKRFGCLATFWFGTFAMLFCATGHIVCHENTWRWMACCYKGL